MSDIDTATRKALFEALREVRALRGQLDALASASRDLVYAANEVSCALERNPDRAAYLIVGGWDEPDSEAALLASTIQAVGPLVFPTWGHQHADERTA